MKYFAHFLLENDKNVSVTIYTHDLMVFGVLLFMSASEITEKRHCGHVASPPSYFGATLRDSIPFLIENHEKSVSEQSLS